MKVDLAAQLSGQIFPFLMIFCRLGAGMMMFPGIGEAFVTPRIRMMFSLALSLLLLPVLASGIPALPDHPGEMVRLIVIEIFVGVFFGSVMRLMMGIVETTGAIVGMDIGLSNASILNPALASESALPAAFLGTTALVLVFASGLDHLLFRALVDTYKVFPAGLALPYGDIVQSFIGLVSRSFLVGIQLATPLMVMGLLLYTSIGVMQRLMTQIQLFLVVIPVQIWGGLFVFSVSVGIIFTVWLDVFDDVVGELFIRAG
ncbi:MAG: flagellar biosynthetic protein FliR [Alphaproteobacteria bacterium]|nr:flagellar biosynthetic protein FliR [Alphaproteobacteria bacterium]